MLEPLGFELFFARDGSSAIDMARECRPQLTTLDLAMPGLDGWAAAEALRGLDLPDLRIVIVSANAHELRRGDEAGSVHDAFLTKPLDIDFFLDRIGALLGLSWRYADDERVPAAEPAFMVPPGCRRHLEALIQLGRIGHVRGIQAKLREIESEDGAHAVFTAPLQELLMKFDLKTYQRVLEAARHDGAAA